MEEKHRASMGKRCKASIYVLFSRYTILHKSPCTHQPESSLNVSFAFLCTLYYIGLIDETIGHWWLIQIPYSLPSSEIRGGTEKFQTSICGWFTWQPHPSLSTFQKSPHQPSCGGKGFIMNNKTPILPL